MQKVTIRKLRQLIREALVRGETVLSDFDEAFYNLLIEVFDWAVHETSSAGFVNMDNIRQQIFPHLISSKNLDFLKVSDETFIKLYGRLIPDSVDSQGNYYIMMDYLVEGTLDTVRILLDYGLQGMKIVSDNKDKFDYDLDSPSVVRVLDMPTDEFIIDRAKQLASIYENDYLNEIETAPEDTDEAWN